MESQLNANATFSIRLVGTVIIVVCTALATLCEPLLLIKPEAIERLGQMESLTLMDIVDDSKPQCSNAPAYFQSRLQRIESN